MPFLFIKKFFRMRQSHERGSDSEIVTVFAIQSDLPLTTPPKWFFFFSFGNYILRPSFAASTTLSFITITLAFYLCVILSFLLFSFFFSRIFYIYLKKSPRFHQNQNFPISSKVKLFSLAEKTESLFP